MSSWLAVSLLFFLSPANFSAAEQPQSASAANLFKGLRMQIKNAFSSSKITREFYLFFFLVFRELLQGETFNFQSAAWLLKCPNKWLTKEQFLR
jgi:hypothetical protein